MTIEWRPNVAGLPPPPDSVPTAIEYRGKNMAAHKVVALRQLCIMNPVAKNPGRSEAPGRIRQGGSGESPPHGKE